MYLISYDIEDDRLRHRIAQLLLRQGLHRVQFSVFMGTLAPRWYTVLIKDLRDCALASAWATTDSILVIPIHQNSLEKMESIGAWPERWDEITGTAAVVMI